MIARAIGICTLLLAACDAPAPGLTLAEEEVALVRGREIATSGFQLLSGALTRAMAEGGPLHAVQVCARAARPLTDSLATAHGVRLKRTSHRLRGPHNAPDAHELEQLKAYLAAVDAGTAPASLAGRVHLLGDTVAVSLPILLNMPACLKCHGGLSDLDSEAHALIEELYPGDRATGFALGDLRGMWSIRWKR